MTIIERLGRGLLIAVATPLNAIDAALQMAGARGEVDTLRDAVARLKGERDEARRFEAIARMDSINAVQGWSRTGKALEEAQRAAVELQAEADKARAERDEAYSKMGAQAVRIRELETQIDARADVVPVEAAPLCAWCLGKADPDTGISDLAGGRLMLCVHCNKDVRFTCDDIRARAAARAVSCLSRRTSTDPLAVACTLGCGAPIGQACYFPPSSDRAPVIIP